MKSYEVLTDEDIQLLKDLQKKRLFDGFEALVDSREAETLVLLQTERIHELVVENSELKILLLQCLETLSSLSLGIWHDGIKGKSGISAGVESVHDVLATKARIEAAEML